MNSLVITIPDKLFATAESLSFEGSYPLESLDYCSNTYRFNEPLQYALTISNTGGALFVGGHVHGRATSECVRCLEPASCVIDGEVEGYFLLPHSERELSDEEQDEYETINDDHAIDLEPLLRAALLLGLPYAPLCREDCKGLCPQCGANLNKETCACVPQSDIDENNPFAILKTLQFDEGQAR